MLRKETFGTSGTRMKVRMFGGWDFNDQTLESANWVASAYRVDVPMGGDLKAARAGAAPVFVVAASYRNTIGDTELKAVWQDPDFDAKTHAFYYARVIEIPTPRWSTYDAKTLGMAPRDDLPVSIQERA